MCDSIRIFRNSLQWLAKNYDKFTFFCERDIVWTIQTNLIEQVAKQRLPLKVYNDFPIIPGKRRSLTADIVITNADQFPELAIEFKYEPSHKRKDILKQKLPVVVWAKGGVEDDIVKVQRYLKEQRCSYATTIFIDEGSYYKKRKLHQGCEWANWSNGVSVLCFFPSLILSDTN
jgi:hypothetical protein